MSGMAYLLPEQDWLDRGSGVHVCQSFLEFVDLHVLNNVRILLTSKSLLTG